MMRQGAYGTLIWALLGMAAAAVAARAPLHHRPVGVFAAQPQCHAAPAGGATALRSRGTPHHGGDRGRAAANARAPVGRARAAPARRPALRRRQQRRRHWPRPRPRVPVPQPLSAERCRHAGAFFRNRPARGHRGCGELPGFSGRDAAEAAVRAGPHRGDARGA